MYLLKQESDNPVLYSRPNSHSTMYLLKQAPAEEPEPEEKVFTFHHVSIKTVGSGNEIFKIISFTFHHVSIKTGFGDSHIKVLTSFTFHHVSIKTRAENETQYRDIRFTFHHVSIKTK